MPKPLWIALCIAALAGAEAAAQTQCPMDYSQFELAIPHLDLDQCPNDLARAGAFCRVTTANDSVHVFVFEDKGKRCLLSVKSYDTYRIDLK